MPVGVYWPSTGTVRALLHLARQPATTPTDWTTTSETGTAVTVEILIYKHESAEPQNALLGFLSNGCHATESAAL